MGDGINEYSFTLKPVFLPNLIGDAKSKVS